MSDRREAAARSPGAANSVTAPGPAADRERVLLLECRLEHMRSALVAAREEADCARTRLADACAREADRARRASALHEELADARAEIATLHRRLERSEALRAEIEGHLFEAGSRADADELLRLRRRVLAEEQRSLVNDRTVARLRERVEDLVSTRETLLTRVAEWQQLIREEGPDAADLSEFLAELRREILDLEHRHVTGDAREMRLREQLAEAGIDPDGALVEPLPATADPQDSPHSDPAAAPPKSSGRPDYPEAPRPREPNESREALQASSNGRKQTDGLIAELIAAESPALQSDLLLRLGRSGESRAFDVIRPWTGSSEPSVRAAAYEAMGRLLERAPEQLETHLREGLADPDARVRRRVALAVATARGLPPRFLLEPLKDDPDAQVRRVVREVLRQTPPTDPDPEALPEPPEAPRFSRTR